MSEIESGRKEERSKCQIFRRRKIEDNDKERVESASKQRIGVSFQNEEENGDGKFAREWKSWSVKMQFYVTDCINKMMMVVRDTRMRTV